MKSIILSILAIAFSVAMSIAQTDGLSYQAVILDKNPQEIPGLDISGNYLSETEVTLRFTIKDSNQNTEFQESQMTTTDEFGMVNLIIGQGFLSDESLGEFDEINWDGTPKFLIVDLAYNGSEFEELSTQNLLFVPYALHRNIIATQTLDVDGATTLNSTLYVEDATDLQNTLNVEGVTTLGDDLSVAGNALIEGNTQLNQNLTVDGITVLNDAINVMNQSPTYLSGTLTADGNTILGASLTVGGETCLNDQVTIKTFETGGQDSYGAYPLRIEGSDQGVAIQLNPGVPDATNNYISFLDGNGNVIGRVEGQTADDLVTSPEYIFNTISLSGAVAASIANTALASAGVNICGGFGVVTCPPSWSDIAIQVANGVLAVANLAAYEIFAFANLGVSYQSGSADYAEYLERIYHDELIYAGDIVGVVGGKISLDLENASQILVISTKPAVLGNLPEGGDETNYNKVAFMGQVPVKVFGKVNVGDYIIPSGNNDGVGVGVSPNDITPEQYAQIVGIAWSAAPESDLIQKVNLSIGLNSNDVAELVAEQQKEISALQQQFTDLADRISALENGEPLPQAISQENVQVINDLVEREKDIRKGVYDTYEAPLTLSRADVEESLAMLKELYADQGVSIEDNFALNKLFNDAEFQERVIQETILNFEYMAKQKTQMD